MSQTALLTPRRYTLSLAGFGFLFVATALIAPLIGPTQIDLFNAVFGSSDFSENVDANILFVARFPRILMGAMTGAALSLAGAVFQALLRNDLAAPFTLGVSSGASLGAVIAISLGWKLQFLGLTTVSLSAFLGALGAILLVFNLVRTPHGQFSTSMLLLAGVTANFFFASLVMFLHYLSDFTQSFQIVRWLMGTLDVTQYGNIFSVFPLVLFGALVLLWQARDLNLTSTGVESAMSRGVNVERTQKTGFIMASLVTGAVVSISGPIGFVGLIVPHIVRLIVGPDLRILLPAVMLFGASFLIMCDTVARTLMAPVEIPVGVITAMLGGPFFIWLLKKKQT